MKVFIVLIGLFLAINFVSGQSVIGSKHDLSSGNTGLTKWQSTNERQVCIFCHTPHSPITSVKPLWNKSLPANTNFSTYNSQTMDAVPESDLAGSYSILCMSCHDGTTPMNTLANPSSVGTPQMAGGYTKLGEVYYPGSLFATYPGANIGEGYEGGTGNNLSNDHPVNFVYDASHPDVARGGLHNPETQSSGLGGTVSQKMLFYNKVECPSCHNPHNPTIYPFLRKTTDNGQLCVTCHNK